MDAPIIAHKPLGQLYPTIARLLENKFGVGISIGGVFMLPYFMFIADNNKGLFAKSENFLTGVKAALKYYSQGDKDFDEIYFLGDNAVVSSDFSIGGSQQRNDAHFYTSAMLFLRRLWVSTLRTKLLKIFLTNSGTATLKTP